MCIELRPCPTLFIDIANLCYQKRSRVSLDGIYWYRISILSPVVLQIDSIISSSNGYQGGMSFLITFSMQSPVMENGCHKHRISATKKYPLSVIPALFSESGSAKCWWICFQWYSIKGMYEGESTVIVSYQYDDDYTLNEIIMNNNDIDDFDIFFRKTS